MTDFMLQFFNHFLHMSCNYCLNFEIYIYDYYFQVYRDCRYLDKLMGTTYFHERHFHGLLERVREKNRSSLVGQRMSEQVIKK